MITSVTQHPVVPFSLCSMQMILSGMAMVVAEEAHAVHSTNLHGSWKSCSTLLLMILNLGSVVINIVLMKTSNWKSLNSMYSNYPTSYRCIETYYNSWSNSIIPCWNTCYMYAGLLFIRICICTGDGFISTVLSNCMMSCKDLAKDYWSTNASVFEGWLLMWPRKYTCSCMCMWSPKQSRVCR